MPGSKSPTLALLAESAAHWPTLRALLAGGILLPPDEGGQAGRVQGVKAAPHGTRPQRRPLQRSAVCLQPTGLSRGGGRERWRRLDERKPGLHRVLGVMLGPRPSGSAILPRRSRSCGRPAHTARARASAANPQHPSPTRASDTDDRSVLCFRRDSHRGDPSRLVRARRLRRAACRSACGRRNRGRWSAPPARRRRSSGRAPRAVP